jgi:hypothetical protein
MTADVVFARLRRRPFTPFRLHLSEDKFHDVLHSAMMIVSKSGITLAIYDSNQTFDDLPARDMYISLPDVVSTEDLPVS